MKLTISSSSVSRPETSIELSDGITRIPVQPNAAERLTIRLDVPICDIQDLAGIGQTAGKMPWRHVLDCGAQVNCPFLAFLNDGGQSRLAIASGDLVDDTRFLAQMNQESCVYEVTMTIALTAESRPFEIYVDRRDLPWTRVLNDWQDSLALPPCDYPDAAYDPVFCTWYVTHAAITAARTEELSAAAAALGFRTLIVDDGWCYDEMKRVTPETLKEWYAPVGDWRISAAKFPDFHEHVRRVQALGMKYLLWVAPLLAGTASEFTRANQAVLTGPENGHEGARYLDLTASHGEEQQLVDTLAALVRDNGLDGLKIDFLDIIPPNVDHPTCRPTLAFIKRVTDAIRAVRPQALIEFRQSYANLAMLPYGTQFRAGDAPFDWRLNFSRIAEIRLNIGTRAPVHADPAYWAPGEQLRNVARHMMAACAGVPMLSMALERLDATEKAIIAFYLKFYEAHRTLINHGDWHVLSGYGSIDGAVVENDAERIIYLTNPGRLAEALQSAPARTWLLNMTDAPLPFPGATTFLPDCTPGTPGCVVSGGLGETA